MTPRTCFCPAACRRNCRTVSIALPMSRTTRGSRRLPSRSASYQVYALPQAADARMVKLDPPQSLDRRANLQHIVEGVSLARDLINTPANPHGTGRSRSGARASSRREHSAEISAIVGDDLLAQNFPPIHAVGR